MKPGNLEVPIRKEDLLPLDYGSVWKQMEDCQKLGLTKAIGVSNFSIKKLGDLLGIAEIPPAVNQVSNLFQAAEFSFSIRKGSWVYQEIKKLTKKKPLIT